MSDVPPIVFLLFGGLALGHGVRFRSGQMSQSWRRVSVLFANTYVRAFHENHMIDSCTGAIPRSTPVERRWTPTGSSGLSSRRYVCGVYSEPLAYRRDRSKQNLSGSSPPPQFRELEWLGIDMTRRSTEARRGRAGIV